MNNLRLGLTSAVLAATLARLYSHLPHQYSTVLGVVQEEQARLQATQAAQVGKVGGGVLAVVGH